MLRKEQSEKQGLQTKVRALEDQPMNCATGNNHYRF